MKHIGNIGYADGAKHRKKRIGRGPGSGFGGTSTKGNKGQQSRSGYTRFVGFEGGQMPLNRRIPKFGFNNRFRTEYQVVNVSRLQELFDEGRFEGGNVSPDILIELGVVSKRNMPIKILGNGEINATLNVIAHGFSETAKQKIESAGGTVTVNE
jgi:large subunit ribosomal protein L15